MIDNQYISLREMDLEEALALSYKEYEREQAYKVLPVLKEEKDKIRKWITYIVRCGQGIAYMEDGKLAGFMSYMGPLEKFSGNARGVIVPLCASAFGGENRERSASMVLEALMEKLIMEENVTSFSITRYSHDIQVNEMLELSGFGIEHADAMLDLRHFDEDLLLEAFEKEIEGKGEEWDGKVEIREVEMEEREIFLPLYKELMTYRHQAPCCQPISEGMEYWWVDNPELRIFGAFMEGEAIGFLSMEEEAENFLTMRKDMWNLESMYIRPMYRRASLAQAMLYVVVRECRQSEVNFLGVDYETTNPSARGFWRKYFDTYTYTFQRRVNETILSGGEMGEMEEVMPVKVEGMIERIW